MFLMIQNNLVADIDCFTVLGMSTSRGKKEKIGQFGSGCCHSINLLLRQNINPIIFLGEERVDFYTKPKFAGGQQFNHVYYTFQGKEKETGFCTDFGALDWNSVDMALREFISNAIDASSHKDISIDIVKEIVPSKDTTRIFLPLTPEIQRFYNELGTRFLHFSGQHFLSIIPKKDVTQARIYRKGVLVRQINNRQYPSLFDYNFGDELKIDEARNLDDYHCRMECANAISKSQTALETIFKNFQDGNNKFWESGLCPDFNTDGNWDKAWNNIFGKMAVVGTFTIQSMLSERHIKSVLLPYQWYEECVKAKVKDGHKLITKVETQGHEFIPVDRILQRNFDKVWGWLQLLKFTNNKPQPKLICFRRSMNSDGSILGGYYENGVVYINEDYKTNLQTILEECAHHVSGAGDGSRPFQDFAFQVATLVCSKFLIS